MANIDPLLVRGIDVEDGQEMVLYAPMLDSKRINQLHLGGGTPTFLTEVQLLQFLAQQLNVPFLDIAQKPIDPKAVQLLPEVQARRFRALVLEDRGSTALLGMSDPADLAALDQISQLLAPRQIELAVVRVGVKRVASVAIQLALNLIADAGVVVIRQHQAQTGYVHGEWVVQYLLFRQRPFLFLSCATYRFNSGKTGQICSATR